MTNEMSNPSDFKTTSNDPEQYFGRIRKEILPLLPAHSARALEIGCGQGATLAWLRSEGRVDEAYGVEYMPEAAAIAKTRLDGVVCGDIEKMDIPFNGTFDLLLCLDVLEHLVDPWAFLKRLRKRLGPRGVMVVSLPNAQHHSISVSLLLRGRFDYSESGLMDRTHLRFFTRYSATALLQAGGFCVTEVVGQGREWEPTRLWRMLGKLPLVRPLCDVQYLLKAENSRSTS